MRVFHLVFIVGTLILSSGVWGFSRIPDKTTIYTRKQLAMNYGFFQPGNNWRTSSNVVNNNSTDKNVYGTQLKIRYESYDLDFVDYRLGIDVQGIADNDLLFSCVSFAFDLTNTLYFKRKHRIISVATFAYSPQTVIIADDEQLKGTSYKYGLSFEWAYGIFKNWSTKTALGYNYQKLGVFPTTAIYDPSYMTIRGLEVLIGLNYVF